MSLRRTYETTFIVNAALEDADVDAVISKVIGYVENHGGEVKMINKWGRRRLAYPINKKFNGYYVHIIFDTAPSAIPILERFLILEDTVLRHLTLILPNKLTEFRANRSVEFGANIISTGEDNKTEPGQLRNRKRQDGQRYRRSDDYQPRRIEETPETPDQADTPDEVKVDQNSKPDAE